MPFSYIEHDGLERKGETPDGGYITVHTAAILFGITPATLDNILQEGNIVPTKIVQQYTGRSRLVKAISVDAIPTVVSILQERGRRNTGNTSYQWTQKIDPTNFRVTIHPGKNNKEVGGAIRTISYHRRRV